MLSDSDESAYSQLEVSIPAKFMQTHAEIVGMIANDMMTPPSGADENLQKAFYNVYKIHIELLDAFLCLASSNLVSHVSSGIILRSMLENLAMYSYLLTAKPRAVAKYVKKIEYFTDKTESELSQRLRMGSFSNISQVDDSVTAERLAVFGKNVSQSYELLSAYVHAAPFITKQLAIGKDRIVLGKYNQLQTVYVIYSTLLSFACNHQILGENHYSRKIDILDGMIMFKV